METYIDTVLRNVKPQYYWYIYSRKGVCDLKSKYFDTIEEAEEWLKKFDPKQNTHAALYVDKGRHIECIQIVKGKEIRVL